MMMYVVSVLFGPFLRGPIYLLLIIFTNIFLQSFDTFGWAPERALIQTVRIV